MADAAARDTKKKGEIWPFWTIVGLAALLLVVYLASGLNSSRASRKLIPVNQRKQLPDALLHAVSGKYNDLDTKSLDGKVVIFHFWATWCGPCRLEFPEFAKYAKEPRGKEGIVVVPVSVDRTQSSVILFLKVIHADFPVYIDDGALAAKVGIRMIPTTMLVDRQGRIAWKHEGAVDWSKNGIPKLAGELSDADE